MAEKYLRLDPSGSMRWISLDRVPCCCDDHETVISLDQLHDTIGCEMIEIVRSVFPGIVLIVDESGRIKRPPQQHNELASLMYAGYLQGLDDIVGPAVVCAEVGPDLVPLSQSQLDLLCEFYSFVFELEDVLDGF